MGRSVEDVEMKRALGTIMELNGKLTARFETHVEELLLKRGNKGLVRGHIKLNVALIKLTEYSKDLKS